MRLWQIREIILDIMEKTAGGRVILGVCTLGGVRRDIPLPFRTRFCVNWTRRNGN